MSKKVQCPECGNKQTENEGKSEITCRKCSEEYRVLSEPRFD